MKEIITDLSLLESPSEPLQFLTDIGVNKEEGDSIIADLKEVFDANPAVYALAAPQIGINKRIFGIRFNDQIKFFINPIITKKSGLVIAPETFCSMPNKEILIGRPSEISVVYYTDAYKYEDNKLLDEAARIFDQMAQVLDGVLPSELGLVSDIVEDGPLADLSEEEIIEIKDYWKTYVKTKLEKLQQEIEKDEELEKQYKSLLFSESVINGRTTVYDDSAENAASNLNSLNRAQRRAIQKASKHKKK